MERLCPRRQRSETRQAGEMRKSVAARCDNRFRLFLALTFAVSTCPLHSALAEKSNAPPAISAKSTSEPAASDTARPATEKDRTNAVASGQHISKEEYQSLKA